ncbi:MULTISPECIES: LolA-like outer membrane lipoprotein chaperone [unclassified Campylobacter]|uniref:LolA-like outer membrane lipoprotein chaperone n=1 Tax=unclassified Campylobacter TaxID=2593542 RepID=UPI001476246E|nr:MULTISPECIES: LolA-like outer membrane lipoprotein chaperone [unclassified Campylobacter]
MKKFILFLSIYIASFASNLDFNTIQGDFTQTVTSNKTSIDYSGKFYLRKDNNALWIYTRPTAKKIYFDNKKVVVLEETLEQAIISRVKNMPNLGDILKEAKKIKEGLYKADFDDTEYFLTMKGNYPSRIDYEDRLGNKIKIIFQNVVKNYEITNEFLTPVIPSHYDVINH